MDLQIKNAEIRSARSCFKGDHSVRITKSTYWWPPNIDSIPWQNLYLASSFLRVAKTRVFETSVYFIAKYAYFDSFSISTRKIDAKIGSYVLRVCRAEIRLTVYRTLQVCPMLAEYNADDHNVRGVAKRLFVKNGPADRKCANRER